MDNRRTDSPAWMTEASRDILVNKNYTQPGESINQMYARISRAAARALKREDLGPKFEEYFKRGWLCGSTPVLANMGTDRGLPISCFGSHVADDLAQIYKTTASEIGLLARGGGGTSLDFSDVRPCGSFVRSVGRSRGVVPFARVADAVTAAASQGDVRDGASVGWINIEHGDIIPWLHLRRTEGDPLQRVLKLNNGVTIPRTFMESVRNRDPAVKDVWLELLRARAELSEPYILFRDNVNDANPQCYKDRGLKVSQSNLCTEIMLASNPEWTFVCCLASLNVVRYNEWPADLVETAIYFLDGVMSEFIEKAKGREGFERAVRFAEQNRAIGLGVLGYHTYLQERNLPFNSLLAMSFNKQLFKKMRVEADAATAKLAQEYGEPDICKGYNRRNTHCLAVAPTRTNSDVMGQVSYGIEPITANVVSNNASAGVFDYINPTLMKTLEACGKNTDDVWDSITTTSGSVQHLNFLSPEQKAVFKTAREIDQVDIIMAASERQPFIDQAQSINLFFPAACDPKYFAGIHILAEQVGIKSLYYVKGKSVLTTDAATRKVPTLEELKEGCSYCEG
jgi:ribonucleoside-diphosphate reductase alpha chain